MCKIFENKYFFIIFLLFFFAISLVIKKDEINKNIGAPNIEAPYHVLHTINAYMKNDISQHYFLPTVTLEKELDKFISWGATVPDTQGNYFYTSFTSTTFVLPYLYFKITGAELTIQNLVKFNYLLQLLSIIMIFLLLRKINFKASQNQTLSNVASFLASILIFVFSTQFMISFGLGYWAQSVSQILIITQLYILISIIQDGFSNKKLILLGFVSIIFCYTEWTGFSTTGLISLYFLYLFLTRKEKENLKIFFTLMFSIVIGGLLIFLHYGLVIGFENLLNALYSRFSVRSTGKIDYIFLLIGYVKSYGLYIFILPILYFILQKNENDKIIDYKLFYFPIFFSLVLIVENIIMMQHAVQFSFDRLKFGILLVILFNVFFLDFLTIRKNIYYILIILGLILLSVIQNIDTYKNTLKQYAIFESIHEKNIEFIDLININNNKSILCSNIDVRGYFNLLINRSIYEGIQNLEKCKELAKERNASTAIFFSAEWIFNNVSGFDKFKVIPEFLKVEIFNLSYNTAIIIYPTKYFSSCDLSDNNWEKGISIINKNLFFVENIGNIDIKPNDVLKFSSGKRKVVSVENMGKYINIFISGEPLDSIKDGYPNKIELIKEE